MKCIFYNRAPWLTNSANVITTSSLILNEISFLLKDIKDCVPYLFHGFRNKCFNKISLDNMLYFQNKLYKF